MHHIKSVIDHLVVVAASLDEGTAFCAAKLGVEPEPGGEHAFMGTHNRLLHLGGASYLEVIAVNPAAPPVAHRRWFGMDEDALRMRTAEGPWLATFVAAANDVHACASSVPELGPVQRLRRDALEWQMTIRDDGSLMEHGTLPPVIQWPVGVHPTARLADRGCRLQALELHHPQPANLRARLDALGLDDPRLVIVQAAPGDAPSLAARIATPGGVRRL